VTLGKEMQEKELFVLFWMKSKSLLLNISDSGELKLFETSQEKKLNPICKVKARIKAQCVKSK